MIDNSALYNLTNPAFTQDIGTSIVNAMYPVTIDPISGTVESSLGDTTGRINNGQPQKDTYTPQETKRDREKRTIKNILLSAGALLLGAFAVYKLKVPFSKLTSAVKKVGNKCFSAIKKGYNSVKTSVKSLITKIKN